MVGDQTYGELRVPPVVGYYEIGGQYGLRIGMTKRPLWLHRWMVRLVLGFKWGEGSPV